MLDFWYSNVLALGELSKRTSWMWVTPLRDNKDDEEEPPKKQEQAAQEERRLARPRLKFNTRTEHSHGKNATTQNGERCRGWPRRAASPEIPPTTQGRPQGILL